MRTDTVMDDRSPGPAAREQTPGPVRAVIFDCDGVILDSAAANRAYYDAVLAHIGKPPLDDAQFAFVQSATLDAALAHICRPGPELEAARAYRHAVAYHDIAPLPRLEPDFHALTHRLRDRRMRLGLATNRGDSLVWVLDTFALRHTFDLVVGALDVDRPKPHPQMLRRILAAFDLPPDQVLYVGDSAVDAAASRAAGIPLVAFRNRRIDARHHIDRLLDLLPLVDRA